MKYLIPFLICCVLLFGCHDPYRGGSTDVTILDKSSQRQLDGSVDTRDRTINIQMASPASPDGPSKIVITKQPDGTTTVQTFTSAAYNVAGTLAKVALLEIPMYVGAALVLIALGVFLLLRDIKWAIIIGATGVGMIVGTYLLAEYAIYFLCGVLVIFAYLAYLLIDYMRQRRANDENVRGMQILKETGVVDKTKANALLGLVQSRSTKKIVEKVKKNG